METSIDLDAVKRKQQIAWASGDYTAMTTFGVLFSPDQPDLAVVITRSRS